MSENEPEIYASTDALLRHLCRAPAPKRPVSSRRRSGDVDQIGPDQIEEWIRWAIDGEIIEPTGGGRFNITAHGQGIIGPPDYER